MLILVLVLKDSLRTFFKSLSLPWSLGVRSLSWSLWVRSLMSLSWSLWSSPSQSALEFCPIHCPNGRLGQDLGFGEFAFALELPELLNRNLAAVRAKLGQTSSFPNGPQIWFPIGQ